MINIIIMDNPTPDSYGTLIKKDKLYYYAFLRKKNDIIECIIYKCTPLKTEGHYSLDEIVYKYEGDDNFMSPTTLARQVEKYFDEEVNWVYYNREDD